MTTDGRQKDRLYVGREAPEPFEFNEPVARVFEDMLERSVPMYTECQTAAIDWCLRFVKRGSQIYDLGCSTGTLLSRLSEKLPADLGVRLVGVDNSAPMLKKARGKLAASLHPVKWVEADLNGDFALGGRQRGDFELHAAVHRPLPAGPQPCTKSTRD